MRTQRFIALLQVAAAWFACSAACAAPAEVRPPAAANHDAQIERGRYMVVTGHCNNCHTEGYAAKSGDVPEAKWLLGNSVGWRSKTGTVYAPNLRLYVQSMSVEAWLVAAREARPRPPMPWWSLSETNDDDLVAMYAYIASLKPVGVPAPSFLPPHRSPAPPYTQLPDLSFGR